MRVGAEREANRVRTTERRAARGTIVTAVRMSGYPILLFMLALAVFLIADFRIAPVAAAEQAQSREWRLAVDGASEPGAPEIAKVVRRLEPKTGATVVAWSPDGKRLASMGGLQERITLWDARSGDMIWEAAGDLGGGDALAFSGDGRLVLASTLRSTPEDQHAALTLLDASRGTTVGRVSGPFPNDGVVANFARRIALDRKGELMAVIAAQRPGRPVALYDTRDWALEGTVVVDKDTPQSVVFSPDGTLAVGTVGGQIALFDAHTRALKRAIEAAPTVQSMAYSPDGKYLAAGAVEGPDVRHVIRIWNAADGKVVRSYPSSSSPHGLAWSPDGRYLASGSFDDTMRVWRLSGDGEGQIVATIEEGVWSVAFSPDGKFLAGGGGRGVIIAEIK